MTVITGIAGSLRGGSFSQAILAAIATQLPQGAAFQTIDIGAMPHYNEDLDGETVPETVAAARALVGRSDAVIIVTPEFNHGLPGVLKNTLDWLSRPAFASSILGKPVMFVTHSPGALGGVRAQAPLREALSSMLCRLVPLPELAISHVGSKIEDGRLTDGPSLEVLKRRLDQFLIQAIPGASAV